MNEFDLIHRYFNRASKRTQVALGVGDDAAILKTAPKEAIVLTTDSLIENVHFYPEMLPEDLGYKALAVNLSDLAAMGAEPISALLSLTMPKIDEKWLNKFSQGFFELADRYNTDLIGGNISRGPLNIGIQVQGVVPEGKAILRSGAKVSDLIFVSGQLGAAAAALEIRQGKLSVDKINQGEYEEAWHRPSPCISLGIALRDKATAAIDISDGLLADLQHLLEGSQVGANLWAENIPYVHHLQLALYGGEDYQLCFTAPAAYKDFFVEQWCCYCIGEIISGDGIILLDKNGSQMPVNPVGFQHF